MEHKNVYFDRDLSWLTFNYRVLLEASDRSLPLYERIKFLGIFSNNLDEFFRVRVASIRSLKRLKKKSRKAYLNFKPKKVLNSIHEVVDGHQNEFGKIFRDSILPELRNNGIILYEGNSAIPEIHRSYIANFFRSKVLSYLQPVIINDTGKGIFLANGALYFVIRLWSKKESKADNPYIYAHLNIPSDKLPRFLALPPLDNKHYYIFLDDVIRLNLSFLFPGYDVIDCYSIKINRDADLQIEDEFEGDLVEKIKSNLSIRRKGLPARFLYDLSMPDEFLNSLKVIFQLRTNDLTPGGRYHNLSDLMDLPNPLKPQLEVPPMPPLRNELLDSYESMFDAIEERDRVLHFPYQSYDYVLRFFNEASVDASVTEIKITLYRIAADSFIANSLISAAKNGKKVTVFVEVKARFDEENNLKWASEMEEAGIRIIYSIPGLKVHAKVALISRRRSGGALQHFAFLGTGNFNENTAKIYADHGIFTVHKEITAELDDVFRYLCNQVKIAKLDHLLVAKHNLQEKFIALIDREIQHAEQGEKAYIMIKLNNLQDEVMIDKLYEASRAGVKIDLIVRAICCLVPEVPGQSENITLYRIVDRFLEHARVLIFHNKGDEEMILGSSDWMKRNLYRRIEVCYPVYDDEVRNEIKQIISFQLSDNVKGKKLDSTLTHYSNEGNSGDVNKVRSQQAIYEWLSALNKEKSDEREVGAIK